MAAACVADGGFGGDHVVSAEGFDAGDGEDGGEFVAGDDGPCVRELLFSVHDAGEVDASVWCCQEEGEARFLDDNGERGWGDDVGVACCTRCCWVVVEGALGEDGTGEFAHFFSTDEVGACWREDPAFEFFIDWHGVQLRQC